MPPGMLFLNMFDGCICQSSHFSTFVFHPNILLISRFYISFFLLRVVPGGKGVGRQIKEGLFDLTAKGNIK